MANSDARWAVHPVMEALEARVRRLLQRLPRSVRRKLDWLLDPAHWWLRIPVGLLLIAGGFLGFLPILGFWMVPLGVLLVAQDLPPVRRLTRRLLAPPEPAPPIGGSHGDPVRP